MKVRLLGSSVDDPGSRQYVSSYLINETVAVDAGCLGFYRTPKEQEAIRHVFLTHSHADHIASLPIFVENVWTPTEDCPSIHGSSETLDSVRKHVFNNVIWPDFIALSKNSPPFLRLCPLKEEATVEASGLQITPIDVNHLVRTFGYVIRDERTAIIIAGDSGPTSRLWEVAHRTPGLRAIFLEACFPNSFRRLAEDSLHLTPVMFAGEVAKMPPGVKVIAVHIKVRYREQVVRELRALGLPNLEIGKCEREYVFEAALPVTAL